MNSSHLAAILVAPLISAVAVTAAPVQAAGTTPFSITETVDFTGAGDNTFTATGPLCPSGTFTDDIHNFAPNSDASAAPDHSGGLKIHIRTVYTCDDGSGSFYAGKSQRIDFVENGFTATGPIQLTGGTGDYVSLRGHGVDTGTADFDEGSGVGLITGVVTS